MQKLPGAHTGREKYTDEEFKKKFRRIFVIFKYVMPNADAGVLIAAFNVSVMDGLSPQTCPIPPALTWPCDEIIIFHEWLQKPQVKIR